MRVFVSSTIQDMTEERDAAMEVLVSVQHEVRRSEFFPAMSSTPERACLDEARNCHIFLGIYKNRYGSIPTENNPSNKSVPEMEYDEAKGAGRALLVFKSRDDTNRERRLSEFLNSVGNFSSGVYLGTFDSIDDLKYEVLRALVFHLKTILHPSDFQRLEVLQPGPDPYRGSIPWSTIEYEECERRGFFSGITIGTRRCYMRWNSAGEPEFFFYIGDQRISQISGTEFWSLMNQIFDLEQVYWIQKDIYRTGS